MLYGLYRSAQGAQAQTARVDVLANNLANSSTTGFKRDLILFQSHRPFDVENGGNSDPPGNQNALSGGITPARIVTDFSNGSLVRTGGTYDLALSGPGFFQVTDGRSQFLTRNGQFTVNRNGELVVTGSGLRVLSNSGSPIVIPADATRIDISNDGSVTSVGSDGDRTEIGRLGLVQPQSMQQLQKLGNSLYRSNGSVNPAGSELQVRQGFVEASGVNPVSEMVEMIQASRAVEANINLIKFQDDSLDRLLQMAGNH